MQSKIFLSCLMYDILDCFRSYFLLHIFSLCSPKETLIYLLRCEFVHCLIMLIVEDE